MSSVGKNVVVIGTGYWGKNHVRTFAELGALRGIHDADPARCAALAAAHGSPRVYATIAEVADDPAVEGVVIATPAGTHRELAEFFLTRGKHAFVEKPLALRFAEAEALIALARRHGKILMVGHLLQYHPAIEALHKMVRAGELGQIEYVYSNRLNMGKIRAEENILWSFAPHDISLLLSIADAMPIQVNVTGGSYLQPNIADTTISSFVFDRGIRAHIFVSWLHPFKEQRLVVIGSKKMARFEDSAPRGKKLAVFEKKVSLTESGYVADKPSETFVDFDEGQEPLKRECAAFLEAMASGVPPITGGEEGARVLKVLQSCQRSLQMGGQPVQVMDYRD